MAKLFSTALCWVRDFFYPPEPPRMLGRFALDRALSVLKRNGLEAHHYFPEMGIEDKELSDAVRLLGDAGYIITKKNGWDLDLVGTVVTERSGSQVRAEQRRAQFRII